MGCDLNNDTRLTIGRLARESGLNTTTVRYYQQRGLLRRPERPLTGSFRSYGKSDLERLKLIKQAQELGFTLAEISHLITHIDQGDCREIRAISNKKLQNLRAQIKLLESMSRTLSALLAHCSGGCDGNCALVERLRGAPLINDGDGKLQKCRS